MRKPLLIVFFKVTILLPVNVQIDSTSLEKNGTEPYVDSTRGDSMIDNTVMQYLKQDNNRSFSVNRWSFSIKPKITSIYEGMSYIGFQTGFGGFTFS